MLRPPYTSYGRLFVYYLDRLHLPPVEHPDLIGIWIEDENAILFFHTEQSQLVNDLCARSGAQIIYQAEMDYADWEAGVVVSRFNTRTLMVRPVWENAVSDDNTHREIVIDPSVIFGSGFHPTTRLCLEALELVMLESGSAINRVADLGTGTGLLAIAAASLGAQHVLAVDNNPLACSVARSNVSMNNCQSLVDVQQHDLQKGLPDLSGYDLVIANLYKGLLVQLFSDPAFWKAGMYMISGIIPAMEPSLLEALPQKGIRFLQRGNKDMWRLWLLALNTNEEA